MDFPTSRNGVSIKVLVALGSMGAAGIASATYPCPPSCTESQVLDTQPNTNPGLVQGTITLTGANTAVAIANTTSGIVGGGSGIGGGFAALPAGVTRFALPGQGGTGAAAAPGGKPFNAWFGYSRSEIEYEYAPLRSDGDVDVYLLGLDYTLKSNVVVGLAISWDKTDIALKGTNFGAGGTMTGDGVTYTPYIGIPINKNWSADISAGWGTTDVDTNVLGASGTMEDERTTFAAGLTYRQLFGADSKWMLTGRGGYIYVKDKLGSYTMSNGTFVPSGEVEISQIRFGGQAAYNMGTFVPYVGLSYIYDFEEPNQPGADNDSDGWQGTLGIRFSAPNGLYGGLQYSSEFSRDQIKNDQFMLNLGIRF